MKIVVANPPVLKDCCDAFQVNLSKTLFTYGDTLYNPSGIDPIHPDTIAHEEMHGKQQNHNDEDAALWWGKYLRNPQFRADQEAEAYGAQYAFLSEMTNDRERRHKVLFDLSLILSGPLYGKCIGQREAMMLIKQYSGL